MGTFRGTLVTLALAMMTSGLGSAATSGPFGPTAPISTTLTDWNSSLSFPQFNPALGTLTSVTIDVSGTLTSTLTITNTSPTPSHGTARTELFISVQESSDLGFTFPPTALGTGAIDALTPAYSYVLAAGGNVTSGLLSKSYDSGPLVYGALAAFVGGGNVTINAATFTQTDIANTGGNTTGAQVTNASLTGSVTYSYTPGTPQLSITKTPVNNTVAPGGGGTFTLTVSNAGTAATSASVLVTDPVPAGLTVTGETVAALGAGMTATVWDCSASAGQSVSCTTNTVLPVGSSYQSIVVAYTATAGAAAGSPYTNTGTVTGGGDPTAPHTAMAHVMVTAPPPPAPPPAPVLSILKTDSGGFVQGGTGTFTITVTNTPLSPAPTTGIAYVSDPFPVGLTPGTATGTGWSCVTTGQNVVCTRSDILASGASYPPITVPVAIATNAAASLTNVATVSGGGDPNNHSWPDTVTLNPPAMLSIVKTASNGGVFTLGGAASFTLTVSDKAGSSPTSGTVTVTDTLPPGLTPTAASGAGWGTCSITGQAVSCSNTNVLAPGSSYNPITVNVNVASNAMPSTNIGVVSCPCDPTGPHNGPAPYTVNSPVLSIVKTASNNGVFTPGGTASFTLTVSNRAGTAPTSGTVTVTDALPTGLTPTAASGAGWGTCTIAGQTVSCPNANVLGPGGSYNPIVVNVNVASNAVASTNIGVVSCACDPTGPHNGPAPYTVNPPVLSIVKTASNGGVFTPGGIASFSMTVSNLAGTSPTSGTVTVTDTLPAGLTPTAASGAGWGTCTIAGQTVSCPNANVLAPGSSYNPILVNVNVAVNATANTNIGVVSCACDPTGPHNGPAPYTVNPPVLSIVKTASNGGVFLLGGTASFSLTVSNQAGTSPTSGTVTATDTLPAGLTPTAASGTGWGTCTITGQAVSCPNTNALAPGNSYNPIVINVNVALNATPNTNIGTVSCACDPTSPHNGPAPYKVNSPVLSIVKTASNGGAFQQSGTASFSLTVTNQAGTAPTSGTVTVTDTLPAGLTPAAASGSGWGTCTITGQTVTCPNASVLAPGSSYNPITINVNVAGNAASNTNIGTVSCACDPTGPHNGQAPYSVNTAPNLVITKTFTGNPMQGGSGSYLLTVMNSGAAATGGLVTLTDPLATGLIATGISGSGWMCTLTSLSCTRSDALAPGASYPPVTVMVNFAPNAPATIVNVANVTGGNAPPSSTNSAQSTVSVTVVISSVGLTKTADRSTAQIGDVVGYTIVVTNTNAFPFTNDAVSDTLPPGFEYVAGSGRLTAGAGPAQAINPGSSTGTLVFNLGTLAANQMDTITYRARIGAKTPQGRNVNTAQLTGKNPSGGPVASPAAGASVMVTPGLFTYQQFLIGRVFVDANGNGSFDKGERPVAGARVYSSTGQSASTDSQGLYNIPFIAEGSVVVSLDAATIPKGYTLSSGGRLDAESWSRLIRTPLQGGSMLRQNFALRKCPDCQGVTAAAAPAPAPTPVLATSMKPAGRIEVLPQQESIPADGRSTMEVRVRVLDADGNLVPAKEIRVRASAGQFVPATDSSVPPGPSPAGVKPGESNLLSVHTTPQLGRTTEQVPETLQAGVARMTQGEATFQLLAANQPGSAEIIAETGDPDHLLRATAEIYFMPEKRTPILVSDGEVSVGRAAPDLISYGQDKQVVRHGEAFLRTPLGDDLLLTLAYTSHLTVNSSAGNPGLFQLDPLDRVYQVFGDSSTQYQMAQSNSHVYGRLDYGLSYLLFGDIRMGANPAGEPVPASQGFVSAPGDPPQISSGAGDYNRSVVGAAVHVEDKRHDSIIVEGARPNSAYARDIFPGSTFGLVQLSHVDIVPGSENGFLEVRNRTNPEILISREALVRSVDYTLDTVSGGIFFLRTLNAFDMNLDLIQLVFTYEYQTIGQTSSVYGARGEIRLNSLGTRLGMGFTDQRDPTAGAYYLGNVTLQQKLPNAGRLTVEVPVSHGSSLAAGYVSSATNAPADVNGIAIRADLIQPFDFMQGRLLGSYSKTDQNFFNPFGTIAIPGAQTGRAAIEITPHKGTRLKFTFTDETNHTSLVNNQRQTGSFDVKQFLTEHLSLAAGYDYRDFQDTMNVLHIDSEEVNAGLEWRPTSKLSASVKREQNLTKSDPTYPNETLLSARYQVNETVRLFLTQRFASAPIIPIADLSTTGLVTPSGKNETSIGVEDKWSRYASLTSGYLIENGINGTDSFAVIGLVDRIPLEEHFSIDLGLQRGQLLTGKDASFDSGAIGFSWLPVKSFKASTRYEIRDQGGLGQIFTTGAAGRLSSGVTLLGRYQVSSAAFQPGSGAIDLLNPLSTNPFLSQQTSANLGTAAVAWRNWKTDREGVLFSWTLRTSNLSGLNTTLPQNDRVDMVMTDAYYQPHRRVELYGKFALSNRQFNYLGSSPEQTLTYLYQGRAQLRISRRFDAAAEARFVVQPVTSIDQWTADAEGGFWILKDLRVGLGYNFKSADQIAANFLTNPVRQGVYFVLSSKLSNMFNLFDPHQCKCAPAPAAVLPSAPKPVPNIHISAITGVHDVCPGDNLRLEVTASGWLPGQTPVYQWYLDGQPVPGATGAFLMVLTANGSGLKAIRVTVAAGDVSATSDIVNVTVKRIGPPVIQFGVSPAAINYGDKATLTATSGASECAVPAVITYTSSEGAIAGTTFDSTGMPFDMTNRGKLQTRVVQLTATATDRIGQTAVASASITVTLPPAGPLRFDDIIFSKNSDRVNNCGKRLLLDELTPMLQSDPDSRVILIGHRDGEERKAGLDGERVLNAAAVLSAGTGICPSLDLSRVLLGFAGTDQSSEMRPFFCGGSVKERPGQGMTASDKRAPFRRVEVWFIPGGAALPSDLRAIESAPAARVQTKGCPK